MMTLLIDTGTERGIVSIVADGKLIYHCELPFGYTNSKFLLPKIHEGLIETGLNLNQFSFIAAGVGPGSYTGIRIGAVVAKSFAFACNLPLIGVCSLEGFIPVDNSEGRFAAMIDAKIGGVYLIIGEKGSKGIVYGEPALVELPEVHKLLNDIPIVVTPNAERLKVLFAGAPWKWEERAPCPTQIAHQAIKKFANGQYSSCGALDLLYLRKTQAEIEKAPQRGL